MHVCMYVCMFVWMDGWMNEWIMNELPPYWVDLDCNMAIFMIKLLLSLPYQLLGVAAFVYDNEIKDNMNIHS